MPSLNHYFCQDGEKDIPESVQKLNNRANRLRSADLSDRKLLDFIQEVNSELISEGLFKGILIVVDN